MISYFCISIRFLQPYVHGRRDSGVSEWPPSPLRMMQALIAAGDGRWNERISLERVQPALRWIESLPPPQIVAPKGTRCSQAYRLYVPDNVADKVAGAWCRGRDASIADYRVEKDVAPLFIDREAVYYLYELRESSPDQDESIRTLTAAARSITHLGWGIDMAVGDAAVLTLEQAAGLEGIRWRPSPVGGVPLRVPKPGSLDDLVRKHHDFLNRLVGGGFRPVPPLRAFDIVRYRSENEVAQRPFRLFELRNLDGSRCRYPHRRLMHLAGMVRHLATEAMKLDPPRGVGGDWVESYVAGHADGNSRNHRQFSYLPLPSVGHEHADPGVRRVMIAAPVGDEAWLEHLARWLSGQRLQPERGDEFGMDQDGKPNPPPLLVPMRHDRDGVVRRYTASASVWHSFTPVILPGHDDHKPDKTRVLIERALRQSGIEQPCEFEWSPFSRFRKSYSAHKYDRNGKLQGYFRPNYLLSQTAVHLTLRFHDGSEQKRPVEVPGPITVGAGRHCGLGLFATIDADGD